MNSLTIFVSIAIAFVVLSSGQADRCRANSCSNGGTCQEEKRRESCTCPTGFIGPRCEFSSNPCLNRDNSNVCRNNGTCTTLSTSTFSSGSRFITGNFSCACNSNFTGKRCEFIVNPCTLNNGAGFCRNNATCNLISPSTYNSNNNTFTPANFSCACVGNTIGSLCEAFNYPCDYVGSPRLGRALCQNNSTCTSLTNNTVASGSSGNRHRDKRGDDHGDHHDRHGRFDPYLVLGNFICGCTSQLTGSLCQFYVNPCNSSPCQNGGTCVTVSSASATTPGRYTCTCPSISCPNRQSLDANCVCRRKSN
jgi:Notch-like protein